MRGNRGPNSPAEAGPKRLRLFVTMRRYMAHRGKTGYTLCGQDADTSWQEVIKMTIDRFVLAFAGIVVLSSVTLSIVHSLYWLLLAAFVGLNLFQSAFTGFCPLAIVLKKAGVRPGQAFN